MTRLGLRAVIVALVMAGTAAIAQFARPTAFLADRIGKPELETLFPKQIGDWRVDTSLPVILPSPDVQEKLNATYNQVLARTYINSAGNRIMLSVAYGGDQSNGTRAHRPEVCYPAQGFQITYSGKAVIAVPERSLPVRQLMSKAGGRNEPITYWVVVGNQVATSHLEQKLAELRYSLKGEIADGMLVRVSSIDPDMAQGYAMQAAFVAALEPAIAAPLRSRVFGSS